MYDDIIEDGIHKARDAFIDSITERQVCALASCFHRGDDCEFFREPKRGSFNVCFFVQFFTQPKLDRQHGAKPDGDRWVVRVPLGPRLAIEPWEKVETEVTTMNYVASLTTIPVPKIHAYSTAREKGGHGIASFMILEYIEGKTTAELGLSLKKEIPPDVQRKLHTEVAGVYAQLRRLEFPAIGRLVPGPPGEQPRIARIPFSLAMNEQELEVGGVLDMVKERCGSEGLTSSNAYVSLLYDLAWDLFEKSRANAEDAADARRMLYFMRHFPRHLQGMLTDSNLDSGPFVLSHDDLQVWKLLFTDDMKLVGVLDWEWAQTVPLQLFLPPLWLSGVSTSILGYFYDEYTERLRDFCSILDEVEREKYGEAFLSRHWTDLSKKGGVLVGMALRYPPNIDSSTRGYLDTLLYPRVPIRSTRIGQFIDEDPSQGELVAKKVAEWECYAAEKRRLGIE